MPNRDKTGPEGKGAKTGRGLGRCQSTDETPNRSERPLGRGARCPRRGAGRGLGRRA